MTSARRETPQYLGSEFQGPGKRIAAFLSAGDPYGQVALSLCTAARRCGRSRRSG